MLDKWDVTVPELTGDEPRAAYVYVPDSIQENPECRYPVLYMFDGQNVFYDEDATYGKSWGMLDYLERTGTQLMVAAVACNQSPDNSRLEEYSPFRCYMSGVGRLEGKGRQTMNWFVNEFKPYVDEHYPTIPDRKYTFIAGSSMGGLMSIYALFRFGKYFSRAAALSPSIWYGQERFDRMVEKTRIRRDSVLYMDYGSREFSNHKGMIGRYAEVTDALLSRGIQVTSRIVPGGEHSEASWERQIPFFLNVLLYGLD